MHTLKLIDSVVDFSTHPVIVEEIEVTAERKVRGSLCQTNTLNRYTDLTKQFIAGIWASSIGAFKVSYSVCELCILLESQVCLIDSNFTAREFWLGNAFVIPAGFVGIWETLEPVKMVYAIWQTTK